MRWNRLWPFKAPAPPHLRLGIWGEKQARKFLKRHSTLRILGSRVRVGKHDEIDLLARDQDTLVIIEVKTRSEQGIRPVKDAVTQEKQWKLNRAAVTYAKRLDPRPAALRFDIVEVIGGPRKGPPEIHHHPGAFGLQQGFRF